MSTRFAIFGSSYAKWLENHQQGYMQIPGEVRFFGKGGMRADRIDPELLQQMLDFRPHYVVLTLGGNDISSTSVPRAIFEHLRALTDTLTTAGVHQVFFTSIVPRGRFKKDPNLTVKSFDKQREKVNKFMKVTCQVIKIEVKVPNHYVHDLVHFNEKGNIRYYFAIRDVLLGLKGCGAL